MDIARLRSHDEVVIQSPRPLEMVVGQDADKSPAVDTNSGGKLVRNS